MSRLYLMASGAQRRVRAEPIATVYSQAAEGGPVGGVPGAEGLHHEGIHRCSMSPSSDTGALFSSSLAVVTDCQSSSSGPIGSWPPPPRLPRQARANGTVPSGPVVFLEGAHGSPTSASSGWHRASSLLRPSWASRDTIHGQSSSHICQIVCSGGLRCPIADILSETGVSTSSEHVIGGGLLSHGPSYPALVRLRGKRSSAVMQQIVFFFSSSKGHKTRNSPLGTPIAQHPGEAQQSSVVYEVSHGRYLALNFTDYKEGNYKAVRNTEMPGKQEFVIYGTNAKPPTLTQIQV
ncbi:hypothetical protein J6590_070715 [Homalodisca vitripennis]|nr:hypothetical protein J6590_070715 [Homalodisca vitripennis]